NRLPVPLTSKHFSADLDAGRCNQPESFLGESRRVAASRSNEDRNCRRRKRNPSAFAARSLAAANFGHIAWRLRSRSVAILPSFVPLLFYQDRQSCARR